MLSVFPGLSSVLLAFCVLIAFRVLGPSPHAIRAIVNRRPQRMK